MSILVYLGLVPPRQLPPPVAGHVEDLYLTSQGKVTRQKLVGMIRMPMHAVAMQIMWKNGRQSGRAAVGRSVR